MEDTAMAKFTGKQLAEKIQQKINELTKACEGLDEATASQAPEGRWTPKEILSHLSGPEGVGLLPMLQAFLDQDTPDLNVKAEDPFFTKSRSRMSVAELVSEVQQEYERVSQFAAGLSQEQLDRKAHIPIFKDTPLGEYPTLEGVIGGLGAYHVKFHTDHMREVLAGAGH